MDERLLIDKRRVRGSFERAAAGYDAAAVLQREVCERMLSRLEYVKFRPATILDAGCGTGYGGRRLRTLYPKARLVELDISPAMLRQARLAMPWWRRLLPGGSMAQVCGDVERLPLREGAAEMLWSNLTLQWCNEPQRAFAEALRVLQPEGLLMFSTFGPDTLKELRQAFAGVDASTHVSRFIDMHDLGDALLAAGFGQPVMDMEYITMTYADVPALLRDLKAIGAHNATLGRPRGLMGRAGWKRMLENYERLRRDGRLPATFEVVYGHAWKPKPRTGPGGRPVIGIRPLG